MGLIDIDDRDVINNFYASSSPERLKLYQDRLKAENNQSKVSNLGGKRYKLDLPVVTCTGGDVLTYFQVPFMNMLERIEIKHVDSLNSDSNDLLSYSISHKQFPNFWMIIFNIENIIYPDIIDEYQNYYESGQYKIISNSTNTDKLYISVYIKITED